MQRWKISVLLGICITVLLISCVALMLQDDEDDVILVGGDQIDPPLHPIASTSYSNSSSKESLEQSPQSHQHRPHNHNHDDDHPHHVEDDKQDHTYLQNYRKRFSDVVKGVFKDLINSKNATTTTTTLESKESTENNSSRLKRQLDFSSASDENDNGKTTKSISSSTPPSSRRPTFRFTTKKPIIRILQTGPGGVRDDSSAASSSAPDSDENKIENSGSIENNSGGVRKGSRRIRPKLKELNPPSNERYEVTPEDNPKNFTYEVVQVERKVVRKEDGHVPAYFMKGPKFNIEPRLSKVEKKDAQNRPAVLYRRTASKEQASQSRGATHRLGRPSIEASAESSSAEEKGEINDDDDSPEKKVVVNLQQQAPYNEKDLSEEDLKDYHDGHSTFGSKGNFTHTLISRNVGGFVPNNGENSPAAAGGKDSLRKRSGGGVGAADRKFVIEKGRVTERYPSRENLFDSPEDEIEIYTVPGGRSSTENYSRKKQNVGADLTSPEVPTSFEDLYRKGHPGVVRAPESKNREDDEEENHRERSPGPFGDSEEFGHPFPYNPLVDDPPLKFDPASDRFYGNPTPDTKEKLALSNSPVKVENPSRERGLKPEDYYKPLKRSRSAEQDPDEAPVGGEDEASSPASAEAPVRNQPDDRFYYDRVYNPPDYGTDYDTGADRNQERGDNEPNYDFVGLDENFAPERQNSNHDGPPDDFFDFPGDPNERGLGGFRPRADTNRDSGERRSNNDYDERTTERDEPPRKPPPPAEEQPARANNPDYENNSRENDYGGFGSSSGDGSINRGDVADDAPEDTYDTGFIQTLKQFDEEIKKLQDEERQKLLQSSPLPPEQILQQGPNSPESGAASGYKKGPPLIITSPGPIDRNHVSSSTMGATDDFAGPPPPPPQSDSSENHSGEDRNRPNNSSAAEDDEEEEDEEANTNRSVGAPEHSTERSGEEEDEEKKKKK